MKFTIELTDDNRINFSQDAPATFNTLALACFSAMLGYARTIVDEQPEDVRVQVKEELYDAINIAASNALNAFAPEFELREDLTTEAILRAENEIIAERNAAALASAPTDADNTDLPFTSGCINTNTADEPEFETTAFTVDATSELVAPSYESIITHLSKEEYAEITQPSATADAAPTTAAPATDASEPSTGVDTAAAESDGGSGAVTAASAANTADAPLGPAPSATADANNTATNNATSDPSASASDEAAAPEVTDAGADETVIREMPAVRSKVKVG